MSIDARAFILPRAALESVGMRGKKNKRNALPGIDQGPLPASERLIAALQDAVSRAREKKLARAPDLSKQALNPFAERPEPGASGDQGCDPRGPLNKRA
jgi:hypothetical protein